MLLEDYLNIENRQHRIMAIKYINALIKGMEERKSEDLSFLPIGVSTDMYTPVQVQGKLFCYLLKEEKKHLGIEN